MLRAAPDFRFHLAKRLSIIPDSTIAECISPAVVSDHITTLATCHWPGVQKDLFGRRKMRVIGVGISPK
jgi:hypothetical protein